jgi:hypothetical protein
VTLRFDMRRDANEREIVAALIAVGAAVEKLNFPCDYLVGFRGQNFLIEIKVDGRRGSKDGGLTAKQRKFRDHWRGRGQFAVVYCAHEALVAIGAISDPLAA